jgi:hypothetical protein
MALPFNLDADIFCLNPQEINPFELFKYGNRVRLMKGCDDGNEKTAGGMEQYLPWLQHWPQISRFLYRQESEESLGKRLHLA